ncbi:MULTISPECIES: MbcA/ParS/Xre antitoxin family protein [Vibrio]|uniref:MbcA/ParS/Xre antitoxin family protein n=1 Tax=Vibrio TaxID=662 RepID=UPI0024112062|nr:MULTISPECIES: MbcA/ParS/Xre antitoxin family protein [Vibrio]
MVSEALLELFMSEELAYEWLNTPKWFFDHLTPLEILERPNGKETILTILDRIRYGDFS